jgi:hypothetical protein
MQATASLYVHGEQDVYTWMQQVKSGLPGAPPPVGKSLQQAKQTGRQVALYARKYLKTRTRTMLVQSICCKCHKLSAKPNIRIFPISTYIHVIAIHTYIYIALHVGASSCESATGLCIACFPVTILLMPTSTYASPSMAYIASTRKAPIRPLVQKHSNGLV